MSSYGRKRKTSYRTGSYNNYRKYGSSSVIKRAKGNFKASKRASDSLNFVVNSNYVFTVNYDNQKQTGVACINVWDVLCRNSNFDLMKRMYDQVRLDGVKYKLNITDATTTMNQINQIKNYTIYTAWDRTGLSTQQYRVYTPSGGSEPVRIDPSDFDNVERPVQEWETVIGRGIVNNSSAKKSILNSFQRWNSYGAIYPSLAQETQQYIQTSDINVFANFDEGTRRWDLTERYGDTCMNNILNLPNPVIPFESTSCRFKPCLLVGVFANGVIGNELSQFASVPGPVIFNAEFSFSLTFRNLKGAV